MRFVQEPREDKNEKLAIVFRPFRRVMTSRKCILTAESRSIRQ